MNLSAGMNSRRYVASYVRLRVPIAASERGSRRDDVHGLFGPPNGLAELKAKLELTRGQHEPTIRESAGLDSEFGQRKLAVTINREIRASYASPCR